MKRRLSKKTDYKQRLALLKSKKPRMVVRRSLNNIHIQIIAYEKQGDKTIAEVISKKLAKYGYKGHPANIPAAYLTGLLMGFIALNKEVDEAVLDIGLQNNVKGSALFAAAKGAKDAGLDIPLGEASVPDINRISGKHIAIYAAKMRKENEEKYKKHFSDYIKKGIEPEKITENFEETKNKIIGEFKKK